MWEALTGLTAEQGSLIQQTQALLHKNVVTFHHVGQQVIWCFFIYATNKPTQTIPFSSFNNQWKAYFTFIWKTWQFNSSSTKLEF